MAQGVGYKARLGRVPGLIGGVVVHVQRSVEGGFMSDEVAAEPAQSFRPAQARVVVGSVRYLFATDGALLVVESERGAFDATYLSQVIQRSRDGRVARVANEKLDVLEAKGLGASVVDGRRLGIFCRTHEPEPGDNAEVGDVLFPGAELGMIHGEGIVEAFDDGQVDWVGTSGGTVFVFELLEVSSE